MSHRFYLPNRAACCVVACLAVSNVVLPPAVRAQPATAKASPQVRYRQAHEAFNAKKWDEARRLLLELWVEKPSYDVAVTLVQVEYQLGHKAAAARYLQYALVNAAPTEKPEVLEGYKNQLEQLKRSVGVVTLEVEPGAEVAVDAQVVGTAPLGGDLFLEPGSHVVSARLEGRAASQTIQAVADSRYTFELELQATSSGLEQPAPSAPPKNGASVGTEHDSSTARLAVLVVGGSLTLVSAGIGVAYAVRSGSKQSDVNRLKGDAQSELGGNCEPGSPLAVCRDLTRAADARNSANTIKTIAFVSSGVLLAGTALTYFLWPAREGGSATRVVPVAGPTIAGLTIKGEF